jgi:hypothetical protein
LWSVIFVSFESFGGFRCLSVARLSSKAGGCARRFEAEIRDRAEIHRSDRDTAIGRRSIAHGLANPRSPRFDQRRCESLDQAAATGARVLQREALALIEVERGRRR